MQIKLDLYALNSNGQKSQYFIDNFQVNKEIVIDIPSSTTSTVTDHIGDNRSSDLSSSYMIDYKYELGSAAMDRPWLLPESRTLQGEISIYVNVIPSSDEEVWIAESGDNTVKSTDLNNNYKYKNDLAQIFAYNILMGSSFELEYQRLLFSFIRALLQLIGASFTFIYLIDFISRLDGYHRVLYTHSLHFLKLKNAITVSSNPSYQSNSLIQSQNNHEINDFKSHLKIDLESDSVINNNKINYDSNSGSNSNDNNYIDLEVQENEKASQDIPSVKSSVSKYCCLSFFLAEQVCLLLHTSI
jgi:hypothetical protein